VSGSVRRAAALAVVVALLVVVRPVSDARAEEAPAPQVTQDLRVQMSDGVEVLVRLGGRGPLVDGHLPARPVIAEFSPYGPGCCAEYGGPEFNYLQVHIRGTGDSNGSFDALGPRSQADLVEVMGWACDQPWSTGRLGLWGFSASAIIAYNSFHQQIPCLDTAVLGSGTHELYRDLLYPGGIPNGLPALGVYGLIGAPALSLMPDRMGRDPLSLVDLAEGFANTFVDYNLHPSLDDWWRERGMRGDVNEVPVLMIDGFFDVESRGAFEAFQELRGNGSHLYVVGAHDGVPVGSGGAGDATRRWFERHLLDRENGIDAEPTVQLWMADGDRAEMLAGDFVTTEGDDWPIPGTKWTALHLDAATSGTAGSLNDGSLALRPSPLPAQQPYVPIPSLPTATDPHTTSLLGVFNGSPELTLMDGPERLGLSYTTPALAEDVVTAGPASLELVLTSTSPETDLYAVISDVWPDGTAHPMAVGRLRSSYPDLVPGRSRTSGGEVIQPYNDLSQKRTVLPGTEHRYFVEFWPIGNRFQAGHRLRLHVIGASGFHETVPTGANLVRVGGPDGGSVLRVPVLPGSSLRRALDPDRGPRA
jgi:putative CocE/NonD family hydrolase